jgi:hypothetical protein
VVGDYYIFGENGPDGEVARLRREFDVNSPRDLDTFKAMDEAHRRLYRSRPQLPAAGGGHGDPLGGAAAPLRPNGMGAVAVVPTSRMDVTLLKNNGIVYVGYLSGLGSLREAVFDHSRFAVGSSYDEIIDQRSGHHFMATSHLNNSDAEGEDYALISSFAGVDGNRIIVIAGTRDAALMQAADYVTRPETLAILEARIGKAQAFEALLGIHAMHNIGLEARLIEASPRSDPTWQKNDKRAFPRSVGQHRRQRALSPAVSPVDGSGRSAPGDRAKRQWPEARPDAAPPPPREPLRPRSDRRRWRPARPASRTPCH